MPASKQTIQQQQHQQQQCLTYLGSRNKNGRTVKQQTHPDARISTILFFFFFSFFFFFFFLDGVDIRLAIIGGLEGLAVVGEVDGLDGGADGLGLGGAREAPAQLLARRLAREAARARPAGARQPPRRARVARRVHHVHRVRQRQVQPHLVLQAPLHRGLLVRRHRGVLAPLVAEELAGTHFFLGLTGLTGLTGLLREYVCMYVCSGLA
ncbi:uncharacterized protein GGS25DRAFT_529674 [Hypoxylon fragiforme]|uniref:uncharacterized protein n=1 Tax=Hypoxylon fragiforme TaxID=63214 RepID=UPI0020C625E3|nr:uncharacterized protein GGS25DRAFT_529674 [Hypoxylon fragiforme]KAI2610745.1 hypothetical protein GGS25DRAFT_529674 [Hypoxylon fragiforme]